MNDLPKHLNFSSRRQKRPDRLNIDRLPKLAPDLAWCRGRRPYPQPLNHFEQVWALHVVEHLASVKAFLEDVHELLASGGPIEIATPHFSYAKLFTDPTHRHHRGHVSLDCSSDGQELSFDSAIRSEILESVLVFYPSLLDRLVSRFAHRRLAPYEKRFAWIFPVWFLIWKFRAFKPASGEAG